MEGVRRQLDGLADEVVVGEVLWVDKDAFGHGVWWGLAQSFEDQRVPWIELVMADERPVGVVECLL